PGARTSRRALAPPMGPARGSYCTRRGMFGWVAELRDALCAGIGTPGRPVQYSTPVFGGPAGARPAGGRAAGGGGDRGGAGGGAGGGRRRRRGGDDRGGGRRRARRFHLGDLGERTGGRRRGGGHGD